MGMIDEFVRNVGGLVAFVVLAACVLVALASPFMVISVVVNVAAMRRALDRIAAATEHAARAPSAGEPERPYMINAREAASAK